MVSVSNQNDFAYIGFVDWRNIKNVVSEAEGISIWFGEDHWLWLMDGKMNLFTYDFNTFKWIPHGMINMTNYTLSQLTELYDDHYPRVGTAGFNGTLTPNGQTGYVICSYNGSILISITGDIYRYCPGSGDTTWRLINASTLSK